MFFISNGSLLSVFLVSKSVNYFWDSMKDAHYFLKSALNWPKRENDVYLNFISNYLTFIDFLRFPELLDQSLHKSFAFNRQRIMTFPVMLVNTIPGF